jgi:hypothetical protein
LNGDGDADGDGNNDRVVAGVTVAADAVGRRGDAGGKRAVLKAREGRRDSLRVAARDGFVNSAACDNAQTCERLN